MDDFTFQCATKIIFGKGTENNVGEETKRFSNKILLHYGKESIKKSGLYDRITKSLKQVGISYVELSGVVPNPRLSLVKNGIELCKENKIDFILAVGGGSVIDSAKAIAVGVYHDGDVWDFFSKGIQPKKALPIGVVLTIPAAGSEASNASVITNEEIHRKSAFLSELVRPKFAILNPELTFTLPKFQTACGIADMMAHVFERYFTNSADVDLTDKLCEASLRSIIKNARIVIANQQNYDARANIMWASTLAHNGLLGTGRIEDWASHGIEHELSAFYDIAHGAGLAVIFPAWMNYVYKHDVKRFAQFAKEVWMINESDDEKAALAAIEHTRLFFKEIGLPTTLKELHINNEKFEQMAKRCEGRGSFVKLTKEDIIKIYEIALG
ncbi:iron-containing alcohol dehydrogenase [Candidatus Micrarchaeota archaeon]|nr:iron-containing alcohol dehydrogenase [Candidatus Micrarchaeota archaeon]MBU1165754.1 iron-containing alcohol dehydrogenase [Candidatus Micrarchaeota archaeon]MBU1887138.1 iron-containing alcohol dehydrogenase [Candidatus Micrarchaeota archaeon]